MIFQIFNPMVNPQDFIISKHSCLLMLFDCAHSFTASYKTASLSLEVIFGIFLSILIACLVPLEEDVSCLGTGEVRFRLIK